MKELIINTGGRPLRNEDLAIMANSNSQLLQSILSDHKLAPNIGFALNGCVQSGIGPGAIVSAGTVWLNGRILEFAGASAISPTGYIIEEQIDSDLRSYATGPAQNTIRTYRAIYVNSIPGTYTGDRIQVSIVFGMQRDTIRRWRDLVAFPKKMPQMWTGTVLELPAGVQLCDGTNGTPDLRGKFIAGSGGAYSTGQIGGSDTVKLQLMEIPGHTHTYEQRQLGGAVENDGGAPSGLNAAGGLTPITTTLAGGSPSETPANSAVPHENRPPFYALAFVIRVT